MPKNSNCIRMNSVNLITAYMVAGALLNIVLLLIIGSISVSLTEKFMTIAVTNFCIVWVARDYEKYREVNIRKKRSINKSGINIDNLSKQ